MQQAVRNVEAPRNTDLQRIVDLQGQLLAAQIRRALTLRVLGSQPPSPLNVVSSECGQARQLSEGALSGMKAALNGHRTKTP